MAFTKEEIDNVLASSDKNLYGITGMLERARLSYNYQLIIDYLTGKDSSVPFLRDDEAFLWSCLVNLLKDIERPTANDHLILNIVRHKELKTYTEYYLREWLVDFALEHNTVSAWQAVYNQFKVDFKSDKDIFEIVAMNIGFDGSGEIKNIDNTPIKEFLLNYIRRSKQMIYPTGGYFRWSTSWSLFYFKLLEEAKAEFAAEYALSGVYQEHDSPVVFFHDYRKGSYMPEILNFIRNSQHTDIHQLRSKFGAALRLYNEFPGSYESLAKEMAIQFLEYKEQNVPKEKWENNIYLKLAGEEEGNNYHPSTLAYYVLLKTDRNKALELLSVSLDKKSFVQVESLGLVYRNIGKDALPYLEKALSAETGGMDYFRPMIQLLQGQLEKPVYLPMVWKLATTKIRALKELVATIVATEDPGAEAKAIELLDNKNADARQTAALVLTRFSSPSSAHAITQALNKESNDNARDILLEAVVASLPAMGDKIFVDAMVEGAKGRGKLKKPVEEWLDESLLPRIYDKEGLEMSHDYARFLLYRMSRVKEMRSDIEARYIFQLIDKERSAPFALALLKAYIDHGARPEHKYLVALAALTGDDSIVDKIRTTTNNWIEESRFKMAEHGVGALALQGSDKALRWVEWYSRKYKTKKANVGAAALAALEIAAEELGITTHELGDRIVPDFGFDGLFKHFTIDGEEYRAFIDSNFKIAFFNEDNKKIKSLPGAADAELKEEFKGIAKEVRDIVKSQSSRLEYYLIIQRRWTYELWQRFFLQNPVMFIYATKLLWGGFDTEGNLVQTFLCNEDTSLTDINDDEMIVNPSLFIGIVHPSQLNAATLQQWKKQFFDRSIESIFPQLDRRMPDLNDFDLSRSIITKYDGKQTATGSIRSTLERYGWHRGPVVDAGMVESYNLLYADSGIEAVLEVEGVGAGYGWGGEEKTGRLYVINKSKDKERWFNQPKDESDERLVKLKDLPPIFLHEMIGAIDAIKLAENNN